jgi:hypothetical protein
VATVTRLHNEFLTREAADAPSRHGQPSDATRAAQLQRWRRCSRRRAGLGYATNALFNAFVDLANQPGTHPRARWCCRAQEELAARFAAPARRSTCMQPACART